MLEDIVSLGLTDGYLDLQTCLQLSSVSRRYQAIVKPLVDRKTLAELPSMSSAQRDRHYGLIDVFSSQTRQPNAAQRKRSGENTVTVFEEAASLRAQRVDNFENFQMIIDTMTMNVLRPIWKAGLPVVLAGGSVLKALHGGFLTDEHSEWVGDFDLWMTVPQDLVIETAEKLFGVWTDSKLCQVTFDTYQDEALPTYVNGKLTVPADSTLIKCCLCVFNNSGNRGYCRLKFDIILKSFYALGDVLYRFDLDCVRLAYNGWSVLTTISGLTALDTGVNTLSLADVRKIGAYRTMSRICKYAARGFSTRFLDADDLICVQKHSLQDNPLLRKLFLTDSAGKVSQDRERLRMTYTFVFRPRPMTYTFPLHGPSDIDSFVQWSKV